jgi:hypothetical protein
MIVRSIGRYERAILYESSNGDVWALTRDPRTKHQPNISSGGQVSYTDIGQFRVGIGGPERQQLLKLIDTLLED